MKFLSEFLLGVFGLMLLGVACLLLIQDVRQTTDRPPQVRDAEKLAREAIAELTIANGWYPALRDPVFSWETDTQGWVLEGGEGPVPGHAAVARESSGDTDVAVSDSSGDLNVSDQQRSVGSHSLSVPVSFPDPATIYLSWDRLRGSSPGEEKLPPTHTVERMPVGLRGTRFYAYDVYLPENAAGYVGCLLYLKDKDGRWFQARSKTSLVPGAWTTVTVDIRGGSPDVEPLGHLGQWDENQASQIRTLGLTFYGDREFKGSVWVDNFRGWMRSQRFAKIVPNLPVGLEQDDPGGIAETRRAALEKLLARKPEIDPGKLLFLNLRTVPSSPYLRGQDAAPQSPPCVRRYHTFEVRFELNRQVYNPFDPNLADVRATVETPSGKTMEVPGFWYQDFESRDRYADDELRPVGRAEWQVRFTPRELGEHRLTVRASLAIPNEDEAREEAQAPPIAFSCIPSNDRGFLRVSKTDASFFEFEDGTFFYPVGHNIHSPIDVRCWEKVFKKPIPLKRGLRMYRDFFKKMSAAGENIGEVWMSSWWLGIEWTKKWRHYHGMGRYSLEHAWKLDKVLEWARAHGIRVHLVIDNHGKFSQWCDWEWDLNPYNRYCDGNGPVTLPSEFFTNARCREFHRRRLRYIAARWGADTTILGWELVSEMDLVGDGRPHPDATRAGHATHPRGRNYFRTPEPQAWVREMIGALREYDVFDHPVTNHYATGVTWVDLQLAKTPVFDYVVGDAYRSRAGYAEMALQWANYFNSHLKPKKPFWVTEYGGNWDATSIPRLAADLHGGLWSTWMTNAGGTPLLWWYDFVDREDLYFHYRAFANFIQGEDRRGQNGATRRIVPTRQRGNLQGLTYQWKRGAYVWVYDQQAMREMPPMSSRPRHEGVEARLTGLDSGPYRIEYWDTYTGKISSTGKGDVSAGGYLALEFPEFLSDMAVKVIRADTISVPDADGR